MAVVLITGFGGLMWCASTMMCERIHTRADVVDHSRPRTCQSIMSILLGINVYDASGDAARRQTQCVNSLLALRGVELVNLQFHDEKHERHGLPTCPVLRQDSRTVTGFQGVRKPIISEMLDALAERATAHSCRWFGFTNSDIMVSQEAIDFVTGSNRQSYVFSRMDIDAADGRDLRLMIWGADLFVFETKWWALNRWRFRPYVAGESCWDNVYAALALCHSDGWLLNRKPLIRHEAHETAWGGGPFAAHNGFMAALDRPYFSLWCRYVAALEALRTSAVDERQELDLRAKTFLWQPSAWGRLLQTARATKARLCYALSRRIQPELRA